MAKASAKHRATPRVDRRTLLTDNAQVILEFTFCMIVILIMIYGVVKVFFWTGRDLAERRISHDEVLTSESLNSLEQIDPYFYTPISMNAVWDGN